MAQKRIVAHFQHEFEQAAAQQAMSAVDDTTESFLVGSIEETEIGALEQKGLLVQVVDDDAPVLTPAQQRVGPERAPGATAIPRLPSPAAAPEIDEVRPNFYLVQLQGPLLPRSRRALDGLGIRLLDYVPRRSYTARLTPEQARSVRALPFVAGLRPYRSEDTGPIQIQGPAPPAARPIAPPVGAGADDDAMPDRDRVGFGARPRPAERPRRRRTAEVRSGERLRPTHDVRLHRTDDMDLVAGWLKERTCEITYARGRKLRVVVPDAAVERELAALPEVAELTEYVPPELHNDVARKILGIDALAVGTAAGAFPFTGAGEIVGVADTGIDLTHPDFQGRIVGVVARGRPNDPSDPAGHGTHVAGSILGDGTASGGLIKGTAPAARLFFQSLLDAQGELGGLPADVGDLLDEAYQAGARVHNNSWGAATRSHYTIDSNDVDEFVWTHPDMLVVISAGNEGQAATALNTQPGYVDWASIGSPASAKNALTVGASRCARANGGYAGLIHGDVWPSSFPLPPMRDEQISDDPERLAGFSSRGPVRDYRIKPDVVAPGTNIVSARSAAAPPADFWGPYPGHGQRYAYMGGTSMAAPLVAGCAALVREYYRTQRQHTPSAALLKATIINGARQLTGHDAVADHPTLPNMHQGFGLVHMPTTIPIPGSAMGLEFVDTWQDTAACFTDVGQRRRYRVTVSGGSSLRVCLAWLDPPASGKQHDLLLVVEHLPTRRKWYGNEGRKQFLRGPDTENTVEVVRVGVPDPGEHMISVSSVSLLHPPQDFALVVTGELGGTLQPYGGG